MLLVRRSDSDPSTAFPPAWFEEFPWAHNGWRWWPVSDREQKVADWLLLALWPFLQIVSYLPTTNSAIAVGLQWLLAAWLLSQALLGRPFGRQGVARLWLGRALFLGLGLLTAWQALHPH